MLPAVNKSYNKFRDDYIHALQLETKIDGKWICFQVHRMVYYCFVEPFDLKNKDIVIKIADGGLDIRPHMLLRLNQKGKAQRMYETGRQKSPFSFDDFKSKQGFSGSSLGLAIVKKALNAFVSPHLLSPPNFAPVSNASIKTSSMESESF